MIDGPRASSRSVIYAAHGVRQRSLLLPQMSPMSRANQSHVAAISCPSSEADSAAALADWNIPLALPAVVVRMTKKTAFWALGELRRSYHRLPPAAVGAAAPSANPLPQQIEELSYIPH